MKKLNNSLKNADGSYSGKVIAGLLSLLIVLTQQLFAAFGIKFTGDWNAIAAIVNTVLTILGILGVVSGGGVVEAEAEVPAKVTQVPDTTEQLK
ncbi:holin [Weissella paramesenteroides]|nr:holin [Weissella paramesenteroides]KAA8456373.1 holin [Weissella paramesenteroides]KAA8458272.1 holin [Weissella paramesenteroides]KAA8460263.1 holin [Weissella paramesenteroides]KAA8461604.1 holin [Weissella paramesenteroides]